MTLFINVSRSLTLPLSPYIIFLIYDKKIE